MAIPWLTVLKAMPWSEVIGNAPKIAGAGKKLWESIGRKAPAASDAGEAAAAPAKPAELAAELARQRATIAELQAQMQASSELIASLAEQNAQLVARIEANRRLLRRIAVALLPVALVAGGALLLAWPA